MHPVSTYPDAIDRRSFQFSRFQIEPVSIVDVVRRLLLVVDVVRRLGDIKQRTEFWFVN